MAGALRISSRTQPCQRRARNTSIAQFFFEQLVWKPASTKDACVTIARDLNIKNMFFGHVKDEWWNFHWNGFYIIFISIRNREVESRNLHEIGLQLHVELKQEKFKLRITEKLYHGTKKKHGRTRTYDALMLFRELAYTHFRLCQE